MADEIFDTEEAEAILKRAAARQSHVGRGVSRERLMAMAEELDIAPEDVEAAILETQSAREEEVLRQQFIAARRGSIVHTLVPYLSVNLMLFVIWFLTSGGGHSHPWFIYPLMGMGIGVVSHINTHWPTSGAAFESAFEEHKKKNQRREQAKSRRAAKRAEKSGEAVATETAATYNTKPVTEEKPNVLRAGR